MDVFLVDGGNEMRGPVPSPGQRLLPGWDGVHGLHDLVDDLALVRDCQSLTGAEIAKCLR